MKNIYLSHIYRFQLLFFLLLLLQFLLPSFASTAAVKNIGTGNLYKWKPIDASFDSLGKRLEQANYNNSERIQFSPLVNRLYQIAREKNDKNLSVRATYWDAWLQFETNTEKTEALLKTALTKVDSARYDYDHARLSFLQGLLLIRHNNYSQAYRLFKDREKYFKSVNDFYNLGYIYVNIGYIMRRIGEYHESYKYYQQADRTFKEGGYINDKIKNLHNIGITQYHLGNPQKGIDILTGLLQNKLARQDTVFRVDVLTSLYYVSQTLADKEKYARKAYKTALQISNKTSRIYTLINMGALYIYKNENDSALYYFKKARQAAEANKDIYSAIHTLYGLAEIYNRKNQPDSAYRYLKHYLKYKEETTGHAKSMEINRLEMRAAIEQYEKELKQADEKVQRHKKIILIILLSAVLAILSGGYILYLLHKKEKINKLLKATENRELNERLQKEKLQNEQFQLKIDMKNRELTSNSLITAEKNQLLKDLMNQIENFANQGLLPNEQEKALKKRIKKHLDTENEWSYFKLHFEKVHPDFFMKLREKHSVLSENDMRLCAYIRISMSTKQIAQMLSVLPETINTNRYRIRKKLQLEQDTSLEDYLRNI